MARIFSGKSFARKDVAQMGSALGAENLRTASVGIRFAAHGTRNFIVEAGPAAAGIEFILRTVQRSTAPAAAVGARLRRGGNIYRKRALRFLFERSPALLRESMVSYSVHLKLLPCP